MPQVPIYDGPQLRTQALQPNYQNNVDVSSGTRALFSKRLCFCQRPCSPVW